MTALVFHALGTAFLIFSLLLLVLDVFVWAYAFSAIAAIWLNLALVVYARELTDAKRGKRV